MDGLSSVRAQVQRAFLASYHKQAYRGQSGFRSQWARSSSIRTEALTEPQTSLWAAGIIRRLPSSHSRFARFSRNFLGFWGYIKSPTSMAL